jgi:hypothetical protein
MPKTAEFLTISLVFLLSASLPSAGQDNTQLGFGFCAPPIPPRCVDLEATYVDVTRAGACQQEVARYVNNAFSYRSCLQREIEHAILKTNATIDRFKCGIGLKHQCRD